MDPNDSFEEAKSLICTLGYIINIKKVKVSHSLIAVGAVGVRVPLYLKLGTADERRSPSLSFRCLILP